MALSVDLKTEPGKLEDEEEPSMGDLLRSLEMVVSAYLQRLEEEGEEAIFKAPKTLIKNGKKGRKIKNLNLRLKKTIKKDKNKLKNRYKVRKQQKNRMQHREGNKKRGEKIGEIGMDKGKGSHKGLQEFKKQIIFRDNG